MNIQPRISAFSARLFWIVLAGCLVPWFWVRVQQGTHSDLLWLSEALSRFLKSGSMVESAYELNPPLSLLIYIVPVMASKFLGIPLHYALFINSCFLVLLSTLAVWAIIRRWAFLTNVDVHALLAGYVLANTILTSLMFGERDHYIALALMPFILLQIAITFGLPYPKKLLWPIFMIGALFILLKPHHGLLPTILLFHRMIHQKRWFIMRDPDFLSLAAMTVGYLVVIWVFFHDYLSIIYPDVIRLYLPLREEGEITVKTMFLFYVGIVGGLLTFILPVDRAKMAFILLLVFSGMVSLIPVYVQGMGFNYHLFPAISFYMAATCLIVMNAAQRYIKSSEISLFVTVLLLLITAYQIKPLNFNFPRHSDYPQLPLTKMIESECSGVPHCSFFMFSKNMGIVQETSHYSGIPFASRFASVWFLPTLIRAERALSEGRESSLNSDDLIHLKEKYAAMLAEDLDRYKPKILIIWAGAEVDDKIFDFSTYFLESKKFAEQWQKYKKTDRITVPSHDYYRDSEFDYGWNLEYDIYRRVKN